MRLWLCDWFNFIFNLRYPLTFALKNILVPWHVFEPKRQIINVINEWKFDGEENQRIGSKTSESSGTNSVDIKYKYKVLRIDDLSISVRSIEVVQTFFEVNAMTYVWKTIYIKSYSWDIIQITYKIMLK